MITNEVIKKEIEDLRKNLILNELEIPSFFSCIWPAIFFALIFTGVPFFLFSHDVYTDDIDLIAVTVFGCFLSVVFLRQSVMQELCFSLFLENSGVTQNYMLSGGGKCGYI